MNRYIIPTIMMVLAAMVYVGFIDPTYSEIQSGLSKESELDQYLTDAKTAQSRIDELRQVEQSFPSDYDQKLSAILPDTIDPLRFIIDVNDLAAERGLRIQGPKVTGKAMQPGDKFAEDEITFEVQAPYDLFKDFLRDLESSLSLRDLSSLSFQSQEPGDQVSHVSPELAPHKYSVKIVTYAVHSPS